MADNNFGKGEELLRLESVQRAIDEAAVYAGNEHAQRLRDAARFWIACPPGNNPMESPLEAIFYGWFTALESLEDRDLYHFNLLQQESVTLSGGKVYRFDFLVQFGPLWLYEAAHKRSVQAPKLAIELDGHEFHERTKEQVTYRNERDRDLQAEGWTVLHFSGSELYRSPLKCAQRVLEVCRQKTDAYQDAVVQAMQKDQQA